MIRVDDGDGAVAVPVRFIGTEGHGVVYLYQAEAQRGADPGPLAFPPGPAAATIERLEGEFGWEVTQVYGLTETAPFITVCAPLPEHQGMPSADRAVIKARQGVELLTSGRAARGRR